MSYTNVCNDCRQGFKFTRSLETRAYCHGCSLFQLEDQDDLLKEQEAELKMLQSDLHTAQSRLQVFGSQKYPDNVLEENGILKGDVRIIVQGREGEDLFAHKYVLSCRSSVFCKMFDSKMVENETGQVVIDDASHEVVKAVIKFCYDAQIDFTVDVTAEEVLALAHKYDISLLQTICEKKIITTLSCENLSKMFRIAKKLTLTNLKLVALQFLRNNFDATIESVLAEVFKPHLEDAKRKRSLCCSTYQGLSFDELSFRTRNVVQTVMTNSEE